MDIRIVGVTKEFGRTGALRGVDLEIKDGELIALLGPSGSGKTTLLRVIAGLEMPNAGKVYFGNDDATGVPVQKRRIGFVFQQYALFKHLTVFDNIAYGLRVRPRAIRPSVAQIATRVHARPFSATRAVEAFIRFSPLVHRRRTHTSRRTVSMIGLGETIT